MKLISFYSIILTFLLFSGCNKSSRNAGNSVLDDPDPTTVDKLKHITQEMVAPPALPKHDQVRNGDPVVVNVRLVIEEKLQEIAPGVKTWVLTFNGTVPGSMIVVHQYD